MEYMTARAHPTPKKNPKKNPKMAGTEKLTLLVYRPRPRLFRYWRDCGGLRGEDLERVLNGVIQAPRGWDEYHCPRHGDEDGRGFFYGIGHDDISSVVGFVSGLHLPVRVRAAL
jgi:hypothetical protein